jgi:hypothetical protein
MKEFLKKWWWVILIAVVVLAFAAHASGYVSADYLPGFASDGGGDPTPGSR